MINKNNNKNKVRTDKRFPVSLSIFFVTLAALMMASGSTATTIVYASHHSSSSSNTGSSSLTPSISVPSSSGSSSSGSSGSSGPPSTPSTSGPSSSGSSSGSGGSSSGSTAHCDTPGFPSCYSLGYQAGKNAATGAPCPSGHSMNYCSGWEVGNRSLTPLVSKLSVPDASYKTAQNKAIYITLTAQDTDSAAKVTISLVSQPTHGSLKSTGPANQYAYTPNLGFSGADSFQYTASDNTEARVTLEPFQLLWVRHHRPNYQSR